MRGLCRIGKLLGNIARARCLVAPEIALYQTAASCCEALVLMLMLVLLLSMYRLARFHICLMYPSGGRTARALVVTPEQYAGDLHTYLLRSNKSTRALFFVQVV
jgi:hypothetical protein